MPDSNDYDALEAQILALFVTLSLSSQARVLKQLDELFAIHQDTATEHPSMEEIPL